MKNTTTGTKTKRNPSVNTSFDVSYAEILAEVQKLQQMLDGNIQTEKKQRKKRTLKSQVEQNQSEPSMGQIEAQGEGDADIENHDEPKSEVKASSHRYKVSNLDEIREKISEVKDMIEEADPDAAGVVAAAEEAQVQSNANSEPEPQAQVETASNVETQDEPVSQAQLDMQPMQEPQTDSVPQAQLDLESNADAQVEAPQAQSEPEAKAEAQPESAQQVDEEQPQAQISQTTKEVVEENADNQLEEAAIGAEQDAEPVAKPKKSATKSASSAPKAAKTTKEPKAVKEPKATKAKAETKAPASDLDAYFIEGEGQPTQEAAPVGLAEERHAAQLAKHGVKNEDEIIKTKLQHDRSGTEWGGNVNLEDDPDLEHPKP